MKDFNDAIKSMPIIPALRGILEDEVESVGKALLDNGISIFEVPIRTKNAAFSSIEDGAIRSIKKFITFFGEQVHVAAGTVMHENDLEVLKEMGINVCLSPNLNLNVVTQASLNGITFIPGVETISEAINAITSGAKGLKIFPAVFREQTGEITTRHTPGFIRYLSKFVTCPIIPSGDAFLNDLSASYISAGATAINVGAQLYEPNIDVNELTGRVKRLTTAVKIVL